MIKAYVMIPTYNERDSIKILLDKLSTINIPTVDLRVLLVDDNSPDLTADYVESLNYDFVQIMRRQSKQGLGKAYLAAIDWLLENTDATHLISMDADGSHRVEDLLIMIRRLIETPDSSMILGSRWIAGGQIVNWPKYRMIISRVGTAYARFALKLKISDLTGGFKIYSRKALEMLDLKKITSNGYCYQIEMAHAISQLPLEITEVPITFVEREAGVSKMSQKIVVEAMVQVSKWGWILRTNPTADKLHYVK